MIELDWSDLELLCRTAIAAAGGNEATAVALTDAVLAAERRGNTAVGVAHLIDYLNALEEGRLNGSPQPVIRNGHRAVVAVTADDGIAQLAVHEARETLVAAARECGVAVLSVSNCFPVGELGYYTSLLAEEGFVALAGANSTALMSLFGAPKALTGTNPLSFAFPGQPPRLVDQASSAVAWVKIREAAEAGESIPSGWALDAEGKPTTDATAALLGPVLPFGGVKGSNLAMVIELLAVLSGGQFSLDSPDFASGADAPRVGMFLIALDPTAFDPAYVSRAEVHFERLRSEYDIDFGRYYRRVEQAAIPEHVHARLAKAVVRSAHVMRPLLP
ncbi:Ldh family oxidoreductase [Streptomyces sp. NPDC057376]|uniref:Ldh family oxidoreductase n=1 Tax=unclassified Streptomyces TaxID=2593676 RepID=UPI0013015583|nr:Ldh family oxidoreductase [Streptomyces sp. CB02414]